MPYLQHNKVHECTLTQTDQNKFSKSVRRFIKNISQNPQDSFVKTLECRRVQCFFMRLSFWF